MRRVTDPASQDPISYWLRDPAPTGTADPPLASGERLDVDVAIVGGGFTGLWSAIALTDTDPSLQVAIMEMESVGWAASGRNGGFCEASLTHGLANGLARWPDELARLQGLGIENLDAIEETVRRYGIDCSWERTGSIMVATRPHEVDELRE